MIDEPDEYLAYLTHLRTEHRELDERLRHIECEWTGVSGSLPPKAIGDLESLRADLARHFEEEESGGCLDEAVSRQPGLGQEADRLEREHATLLKQVDELIAKLKGSKQSIQCTNETREAFRSFAEQLHDHEAAENHVLEQGFGIDFE